MVNRLLWTVLATLALVAPLTGCHGFDRYYQGNCHSTGLSGRFNEGGGCGPNCGGGGCATEDCADGDCGAGDCDDGSCGTPACGGCGHCGGCCPHPLCSLWRALTCSSACGEFYFDEWVNDPPHRCDPCHDGMYVGPQDSCPRWFDGLRGIRGYRCGSQCDTSCGYEGGCGEPGCTSCGHGEHESEGVPTEAEEIQPAPRKMEPTPAMESARGQTTPYYTPNTRRVSHTQPPQRPQSYSTRSANYLTNGSSFGSGVRNVRR